MRTKRLSAVAALAFVLALASGAGPANAQNGWPTRPVTWVLAGAAGSSPDIIARVIGDKLSQMWGQQVIVDNKPGAAGNIAGQAAARAPADGYNYLFTVTSTLAVNPATFKAMPFDPDRDFVGVNHIGISPFMIAVNPSLPIHSMQDLIDYAKKNPGKLTFATPGSRNLSHILGEMLKIKAGINMLNVPYKTNPMAAQDTIAGRTDIYIDSVPAVSTFMGERLRVIAISSAKRAPGFEQVPAIAETVPGFQGVGWFALVAPTGTPPDVIAKVNADVSKVVAMPEIQAILRRNGVFEGGGAPADVQAFIKSERALWGKAVSDAGIQPE